MTRRGEQGKRPVGKARPEKGTQTELLMGTSEGEKEGGNGKRDVGTQKKRPRDWREFDGEEHHEDLMIAEIGKHEAGTSRGVDLRNCGRYFGPEMMVKEEPKRGRK